MRFVGTSGAWPLLENNKSYWKRLDMAGLGEYIDVSVVEEKKGHWVAVWKNDRRDPRPKGEGKSWQTALKLLQKISEPPKTAKSKKGLKKHAD